MPSNAFIFFFDIPELEVPESLLMVEFELISLFVVVFFVVVFLDARRREEKENDRDARALFDGAYQ